MHERRDEIMAIRKDPLNDNAASDRKVAVLLFGSASPDNLVEARRIIGEEDYWDWIGTGYDRDGNPLNHRTRISPGFGKSAHELKEMRDKRRYNKPNSKF